MPNRYYTVHCTCTRRGSDPKMFEGRYALAMAVLLYMNMIFTTSGRICSSNPWSSYAFCDSSISITERVNDLVARIPTPEKISMMQVSSPALSTVPLPAFEVTACKLLIIIWNVLLITFVSCFTFSGFPIACMVSQNREVYTLMVR